MQRDGGNYKNYNINHIRRSLDIINDEELFCERVYVNEFPAKESFHVIKVYLEKGFMLQQICLICEGSETSLNPNFRKKFYVVLETPFRVKSVFYEIEKLLHFCEISNFKLMLTQSLGGWTFVVEYSHTKSPSLS